MEYRVKINPQKEKEFIQLLRTWQNLDLVKSFYVVNEEENDPGAPSDKEKAAGREIITNDIIKQYLDLVD
jgi:hypothetical protein